ncbi:hypothetical protein JCM33374_g3170 [Metschnikowia sp. JCM 33374]|nr:hypothetical protein JCM33374_g3170 [Metschnikowia sp. JCM 33374]
MGPEDLKKEELILFKSPPLNGGDSTSHNTEEASTKDSTYDSNKFSLANSVNSILPTGNEINTKSIMENNNKNKKGPSRYGEI